MLKSLTSSLKKAANKATSEMTAASANAKDLGSKALSKGKNAVAATGKSLSKAKSKGIETGKKALQRAEESRQYIDRIEAFQTFNPIVWILLFNMFLRFVLYFSSNVGKRKANKMKREYTRKHVKETFGVAVVSIALLWYITFKFDTERVSPQYLRDGLFLTLYLNVFIYDYVKNFTKLVNKKYFAQTKKSQAKLGGIYFGIILGLFAFFGILIAALYFMQINLFPNHYNMFGEDFENYGPILVALGLFMITFLISIINFFVVNPEFKQTKKRYKDNMKQYYIDSFKLFYIVYLVMFILCVLAINLNINTVDETLRKFF